MPGLGRRLVHLLRLFWSWLSCVFSKKKKLLDIENHSDKDTHDTQIIPSTTSMARPKRVTANFPKGTDTCQPPLPSEWARAKARFLRSPILKKAGSNNKHQLHHVRFIASPQMVDPPPPPPTEPEPGGGGDPPTIRVEDWSSPVGSTHRSKSKSRSRKRPDKNRLSVNGYIQSGSLVNPAMKTSISLIDGDLINSAVALNQIHSDSSKAINTIGSQDSSPNSITIQSPGRNPRQIFKTSEVVQRHTPNTAKLKLAQQPSRAPAITHSPYTSDTVFKHRQSNKENFDLSKLRRQKSEGSQYRRSSNRMSSISKLHKPRPHSALPTSSLWDKIGFATKMNDREFMQGNLSLFVSTIPYSPGKADPQGSLHTKFFEMENTIDEIAYLGIPRPRYSLLSRRSSKHTSTKEEYGLAELPYPYVFSLDYYFEDSSSSSAESDLPSGVPLTLSSSTNTSSNPEASTSESDERASFDTPTPVPRRASSLIMTSNRASLFGRRASTVKAMEAVRNLIMAGNENEPIITYECPSPPCDFEEELTAHKFLHSNEDTTERRDDTGYDLNGDSADVGPDVQGSSSSPLDLDHPHLSAVVEHVQTASQIDPNTAAHGTSPVPNNIHFEMNHIRASLRSPSGYTYGRCKDNKYGKEGDDSQVSLMESFSSGSTLSHHHHYRHWKSRSLKPQKSPPPLPGLPPEYSLPLVPNLATPTAVEDYNVGRIEPNSGHKFKSASLDHVMLPAVSFRSPDAHETKTSSLTWASMGLPLGMRKPEKVLIKEKDHYRGSAFTRTPDCIVKPPMGAVSNPLPTIGSGRSRSLGSEMMFSSIIGYPCSLPVPGVAREELVGRRSHGAMSIKF